MGTSGRCDLGSEWLSVVDLGGIADMSRGSKAGGAPKVAGDAKEWSGASVNLGTLGK